MEGYDTSSGNATFPAVNLNSANMCLGWSRTKGKTTDPEYKAGDKIPTKTGNYYMVIFSVKQDRHRPLSENQRNMRWFIL